LSTRPELAALEIADPPERWAALGFDLSDGSTIELGGVQLRLGSGGNGISSWTLRGVDPVAEIDGLATKVADERARSSAVAHPNGAIALDHFVIVTSAFDRTAGALARAGMPLRREAERNGARQGFRRLGPAIMEVVQAPDTPTRFWGLVVTVTDLAALADRLGDELGPIRPAVQPGRQIAPVRSAAGLSPAFAFIDPE
jgi:hypothetical protein